MKPKLTRLLSNWQEHRNLFAYIPSQSRFNRRRRALMNAFNLIRQVVLGQLDLAADRQATIDSLPVQVVKFHKVATTIGAYGARFVSKAPLALIVWFGCGARCVENPTARDAHQLAKFRSFNPLFQDRHLPL